MQTFGFKKVMEFCKCFYAEFRCLFNSKFVRREELWAENNDIVKTMSTTLAAISSTGYEMGSLFRVIPWANVSPYVCKAPNCSNSASMRIPPILYPGPRVEWVGEKSQRTHDWGVNFIEDLILLFLEKYILEYRIN